MQKGIGELAELIHPHPSIIEGIQECVRMLLGKSIYKPDVFREYLRLRAWRDGNYEELVWPLKKSELTDNPAFCNKLTLENPHESPTTKAASHRP